MDLTLALRVLPAVTKCDMAQVCLMAQVTLIMKHGSSISNACLVVDLTLALQVLPAVTKCDMAQVFQMA